MKVTPRDRDMLDPDELRILESGLNWRELDEILNDMEEKHEIERKKRRQNWISDAQF